MPVTTGVWPSVSRARRWGRAGVVARAPALEAAPGQEQAMVLGPVLAPVLVWGPVPERGVPALGPAGWAPAQP